MCWEGEGGVLSACECVRRVWLPRYFSPYIMNYSEWLQEGVVSFISIILFQLSKRMIRSIRRVILVSTLTFLQLFRSACEGLQGNDILLYLFSREFFFYAF